MNDHLGVSKLEFLGSYCERLAVSPSLMTDGLLADFLSH